MSCTRKINQYIYLFFIFTKFFIGSKFKLIGSSHWFKCVFLILGASDIVEETIGRALWSMQELILGVGTNVSSRITQVNSRVVQVISQNTQNNWDSLDKLILEKCINLKLKNRVKRHKYRKIHNVYVVRPLTYINGSKLSPIYYRNKRLHEILDFSR